MSVAGSTSITATGDLTISATNLVAASASGDASAATGGAGIALANVTQRTSASIGGSATVVAANLNVLADSDGSVTSTSRASRGGSSGNDASPASRTASGPTDTTGNAHTAEGDLQYAGALSFSRLDSATEAYVAGSGGSVHVTTTGGQQKVNARSKALPAGSTPTTVWGSLSRRIVRLTTAGSAPNWLTHSAWLRMTT